MQKLIRVLILYTAITSTLITVIAFLTIRGNSEQNKKIQANIDTIKYDLEKISSYQQSLNETSQKLDSLKAEIANNETNLVLGTNNQASNSSQITSGFITINDKKWQTIDVYENNSYSSKVVGTIEFDKAYQYIKKDNSWYQIVLSKSQISGWVAGRFLKEIEDNGPK